MDVDETSWSDRISRDQKNSYDQTQAVFKKKKSLAKVKEKEKLGFYFFPGSTAYGIFIP